MIVPLICSLLIAYFFVYGLRSIKAKANLLDEITVLEEEYNLVHERKAELEKHVRLLQPERIDPDFLDEKSRELLGVMHKDEIIIYRK